MNILRSFNFYRSHCFPVELRPDELADLLRRGVHHTPAWPETRLPSKILVKVSVETSSGPVQVVVSPEETVGTLIKRVVGIYAGEKRRPLLQENDPGRFELHHSRFCFECLEEDERLKNLGSREFFLCSKQNAKKPWTLRLDGTH